jgi:hypothetical protein
MAARTFVDERGTQWTVWAVHPTWAERRAQRDRRASGPDAETRTEIESALDERGIRGDRRSGRARRRGLGDSGPRVRIAADLTGGWLAFDGGGDRRRLSPIPEGWETMSDAELVLLSRKALAVAVRRARLTE